jgi:excisionase family DNA binding protein
MTATTFSIRDIAERFGVGKKTVLGWIKSGELVAIHIGRSPDSLKPRWRITEHSLAAFEANRMNRPPAPRTRRRNRQAGIIEFIK